MKRVAGFVILIVLISVAGQFACAEPRVVRIANNQDDTPWWPPTYEKFAEETGIRVDVTPIQWGGTGLEKFLTETAGGIKYDAVTMHSHGISSLQAKGLTLALDPYIKRDHFPINDFFPPVVAAVSNAQGTWAIPGGPDHYMPFINLNMWDDVGLTYPANDWTWDDYTHAMKRLTRIDPEGQASVFGGNGLNWPVISQGFGAQILTGDGKFDMNRDAVIEGLQLAFDLHFVHRVYPLSEADVGGVGNHQRFGAGRVASHWVGSWFPTSPQSGLVDNPAVRWGVAMPPRSNYGQATEMFVDGWFIPSVSDQPEVGWEWIKFFYRTDVQLSFFGSNSAAIPALRSIALNRSIRFWQGYGEWAQAMIEGVAFGRARPFHAKVNEVWSAIGSGLSAGYGGTESARAAMEKLTPIVERILAE